MCSLIFDLISGSNLLMINPYLQPLSQMFSLLPMDLLLLSSSSADYESWEMEDLSSSSLELQASQIDEESLSEVSSIMTVSSLGVFFLEKDLFGFLYLKYLELW